MTARLRPGRWAAAALLALAAAASAQPTSGVAPITRIVDTPGSPPVGDDDFDAPTPGQRADPWEPFNRAIFHFNQDLDRDLLLPWTDAYVTLVPQLARTGIGNFFANAQDLWSAANNLFQGKFAHAGIMTMRFGTNTIFGVFGLIDIATAVGMERFPEDFGQTLGVWGFPAGPYMVLPLFGPSTVRDTVGLPLDLAASPYYSIGDTAFRPAATLLGILNTRSQLLSATEALDAMALDKYSFVRDVFLKRRLNQIFDGEPPEDLEIDGTRRPAEPAAPRN